MIDIIFDEEPTTASDDWHSVNEIPKVGGEYLVKFSSGSYAVIYFRGGEKGYWGASQRHTQIVAWRDIPKTEEY